MFQILNIGCIVVYIMTKNYPSTRLFETISNILPLCCVCVCVCVCVGGGIKPTCDLMQRTTPSQLSRFLI
jgi:hypothetical protein